MFLIWLCPLAITVAYYWYTVSSIVKLGSGLVAHSYHKDSSDSYTVFFGDERPNVGITTRKGTDTYIVDVPKDGVPLDALEQIVVFKKYKGTGYNFIYKDHNPALCDRHITSSYMGVEGKRPTIFKLHNTLADSFESLRTQTILESLLIVAVLYSLTIILMA